LTAAGANFSINFMRDLTPMWWQCFGGQIWNSCLKAEKSGIPTIRLSNSLNELFTLTMRPWTDRICCMISYYCMNKVIPLKKKAFVTSMFLRLTLFVLKNILDWLFRFISPLILIRNSRGRLWCSWYVQIYCWMPQKTPDYMSISRALPVFRGGEILSKHLLFRNTYGGSSTQKHWVAW
jgi:hypothetical protein